MLKWIRQLFWIPVGLTISWVGWQTAICWRSVRSGESAERALGLAQAESCQLVHRPWLLFPYLGFLGIWAWQLLHPQERERSAKTWEVTVFFVTVVAILFNALRCW
jgi:hypothetical protein